MFSKVSLAIVATAAAVSASPIAPRDQTVVLPVSKHAKVTSMSNIVSKGQAFLDKVNGNTNVVGNIDASSGPATNDDVSYVASVSIGGRAQSLIVDTGCTLTCQSVMLWIHTDLGFFSFQHMVRSAVSM